MARPVKIGLDYFPLDTDFFDKDEINLIVGEFGWKGAIVYLGLLARIYKNGYYYQWGEDVCLLFCQKMGAGLVPSVVNEIVSGCVRRSLFDKGVFDMFNILTSESIQQTYIEVKKKSVHACIDERICLVKTKAEKKTEFFPKQPELFPQKPELMQNLVHKEKKSKGKEKEKEIKISSSFSSHAKEEEQKKDDFCLNFPADATKYSDDVTNQEYFTMLRQAMRSGAAQPCWEVNEYIRRWSANGWQGRFGVIDKVQGFRQWNIQDDRKLRSDDVASYSRKMIDEWLYLCAAANLPATVIDQWRGMHYDSAAGELQILFLSDTAPDIVENEHLQMFSKAVFSRYGSKTHVIYKFRRQ